MDLLRGIEADLARRRETGALARAFRAWRTRNEALARFENAGVLIAACRGGTGSPGDADAALGSLCVETRAGDETAGLLLLWLILPGLLGVRSRLHAGGAISAEDLDAELVAGVWEAAARIEHGQRAVARRLVNAARWRAIAKLREAIEWGQRRTELAYDPPFEEQPGIEEEHDALANAVREGVISPADVDLALASRITIGELCAKLGISVRAGQSRRHRARERLHGWLAAGSREPPASLPRSSHSPPPTENR